MDQGGAKIKLLIMYRPSPAHTQVRTDEIKLRQESSTVAFLRAAAVALKLPPKKVRRLRATYRKQELPPLLTGIGDWPQVEVKVLFPCKNVP